MDDKRIEVTRSDDSGHHVWWRRLFCRHRHTVRFHVEHGTQVSWATQTNELTVVACIDCGTVLRWGYIEWWDPRKPSELEALQRVIKMLTCTPSLPPVIIPADSELAGNCIVSPMFEQYQ